MTKIKSFTKTISHLWSKDNRRKLLFVFEQMRLIEKIIFFIIFAFLIISSLTLLRGASNALSIKVPIEGGTLSEGVVGYPRYVNPLLPVTDAGRDLSALVFSGLMKLDEQGKLSFDLAKDYTISDDGLTYTFILKDNIYFHDNTELTAYDIEFTIKKATDPIIKSPKASNWEGVQVDVIDKKTITFRLKKPYAPFIENLTLGILPQHLWKDIDSDAFLFSQLNFEPIGSGPYKIKEIVRNKSGLPDYYHLIPFPKYARGAVYIRDLFVYFFTSEDKLLEGYTAGKINAMSSVSPQNIQTLDLTNSQVIKSPLPRTYAVFFNHNEAKVFANDTVRKALNLATPKDYIINKILLGYGTPIESPIPQNISNANPKNITDEEGLKEATDILTKDGWQKDTNGLLVKKDKKENLALSFTLATSNVPELKTIAESLKTAWEKIGAKVEIDVFDNSDLQQKVIVPRKYDALLFGESTGRNSDLFAFWHSSERNHPGLNIANYTNSKADKILQDIRGTSDIKKRNLLYQSFEKEIIKDNPAIFLYSPDLVYILPKTIQGASVQGISGSSERFATINSWYIDTENVWKLPW